MSLFLNMLKIQIASDLHLEFLENREWIDKNPLIPKGNILLLAGDIVPDKYKQKAEKFYQKISTAFPTIISAMGNHEFYHGIVSYAYPRYSSKISNNHFRLNNSSLIIHNIKFIVSTLWSDIQEKERGPIESSMNDYKLIKDKDAYGEKLPLTVEKVKQYHRLSLAFLKTEVEKPFAGKIVVMTHHLPSYACITGTYQLINSAYATNLDLFIISHPQISLWVCGHAHGFSDIQIGSTRIVRNTVGYVQDGQHQSFRRDFVVEV